MSDPTAVRRAVAIALTEGEPALAAAARRRALPEPARPARTRLRAVATAARASPQDGAASPAAPDATAQALRMPAQAARSGADAAQARANGAPPTDPTVQHAAVACRSACTLAWQQAMRGRAAALHATAPAVPDAWTAPTDRASDAAAWPR